MQGTVLILALLFSVVIAPHSASAQRAGVRGWKPSVGQVARLEARLATRRLKEAPLRDRVRFYSGVIDHGRRYLVGVLITPSWYGKHYDPRQRDALFPESRNAGRYIVPVSQFPSRVSYLPDQGCDWIRVQVDMATGTLSETGCIE